MAGAAGPDPLVKLEICLASCSLFQAGANKLFNRGRRAEHRLRGADGVVRLDLFEAERHERKHGIVDFLVIR